MATILHLTDLHLSLADDGDNRAGELGDYKERFVAPEERQQRVDALRTALREFGETNPVPDLLVVSGDITIACAADGFDMFGEVLRELGSALPAPEHVVVVPGNHDVRWETAPSSKEHYELFLGAVDPAGYVRPRLEGVDLSASSSGATSGGRSPIAVAPEKDVVVVAMNSSNYCGAIEPTDVTDDEWNDFLGRVKKDRKAVAQKTLRKLRVRDAARISPGQLATTRRELLSVRKGLEADGVSLDEVVTVLVLHHHLSPVSTREELKPYESITNLGQLRAWLRDLEVDIVVHGHKHVSRMYWETVPDLKQFDAELRRILVISGPSLGTDGYENQAFRLLDIDATRPSAVVSVRTFDGLEPGLSLKSTAPQTIEMPWRGAAQADGVARIAPIVGATLSDVYARALRAIEAAGVKGGHVANLVCEIRHGLEAAYSLPADYPQVPADDPTEWVRELVEWWQKPRDSAGPDIPFNHGTRIERFGASKIDQFDRAINALRHDETSSRAVIMLVDPESDDVTRDRKFPAFSMAQLAIRRAEGGPVLDCIAYFRKQEMRWWWPINVAEIAHLQGRACEELAPEIEGIRPGSIMTIAAIAKAGNTPPKVVVPQVDRWFDEDIAQLWLLAISAALPGYADRAAQLSVWEKVLSDLQPDKGRDRDGVPVADRGLAHLVDALERVNATGAASELRVALERVLDKNRTYAAAPEPSPQKHGKWVADVGKALADAKSALAKLGTT